MSLGIQTRAKSIGLVLAVAFTSTQWASAQTDLNRFFPKVPSSTRPVDYYYEEETDAPQPEEYPPMRTAPRNAAPQRNGQSRNSRVYNGPSSNRGTPASYQSSTPNRRPTQYGEPRMSGSRMRSPSVAEEAQRTIQPPQYGRSMSGQRMFPNYMSGGPGTSEIFGMTPSDGRGYGRQASRMPMSGTRGDMMIMPEETTVTPDAVYIGEEVPPGASAPMGKGPIYGGSPMRQNLGGFTNPYCNNCENGYCGDDGCYGNCGGRACGCYGECNPYGKCWPLAPFHWLFGGMWHDGPYWGPCDPAGQWSWKQDLTVFGGVHNFRSPVDVGGGSNFGFHEGVNWSAPLFRGMGLGGQFGVMVTQSNFTATQDSYNDYRNQFFLTTGLFHRPECGQGWQYGVAFDWLRDSYYDLFNVAQLRGELGWLWDCQNEFGFTFAVGVRDGEVDDPEFYSEFSAINQHAFYYRRRFARGGEGRIWGGWTSGAPGGLIGTDFRLPISNCWAVESGFNYLIASNDDLEEGFSNESWNIGINLVWYPGGTAACGSAYRPLFNVADNGSFMVRGR